MTWTRAGSAALFFDRRRQHPIAERDD